MSNFSRYGDEDYSIELGCYSSPDVYCRGVKTGDALNNNVAVLNQYASAMSSIGDETGVCTGTTVAPLTTTTTTTTTRVSQIGEQ